MSITLPNLDDRRFDDLVEEARSMIPAYAPDWTDHNAADPGITLIELFAFLSEMLIYRLNRVTSENTLAFVRLIRGPAWSPDPAKTPVDEVHDAVLELRRMERAVTSADYERLALNAAPARIARVRCALGSDLHDTEGTSLAAGARSADVSIVIVPPIDGSGLNPKPDSALIESVRLYLEPRRLLTTRLLVMGPAYLTIGIGLTVVRRADVFDDAARLDVVNALQRFLHPLHGGADGRGWPFGRAVYVSEIYDLLDRVPSVDYVRKTTVDSTVRDELSVSEKSRLQRNAMGELVAVLLRPHELIDQRIDLSSIVVTVDDQDAGA